jgi:hypothetical protein
MHSCGGGGGGGSCGGFRFGRFLSGGGMGSTDTAQLGRGGRSDSDDLGLTLARPEGSVILEFAIKICKQSEIELHTF